MGRAPCCDKANVKKGPWSPEEDAKLKQYIEKNGTGGNWIALPHKVGLRRCGKSCRLRWLNYLRPNIKHGEFSDDEDRVICTLFATIGSRWSIIAAQLPGRTDNDIKNYWNTKLKKKLLNVANHHLASIPPLPQYHYSPSPAPPPPFAQTPPQLCQNFPTATAAAACEIDRNALMFGGSCVADHQIGHGGDDQSTCFQGYFDVNGAAADEVAAAANYGCFGGDQQDYYASIEEIKELITINGSVDNNLSFLMDEIKAEEKVWCDDMKIFKL